MSFRNVPQDQDIFSVPFAVTGRERGSKIRTDGKDKVEKEIAERSSDETKK